MAFFFFTQRARIVMCTPFSSGNMIVIDRLKGFSKTKEGDVWINKAH